MLFTQNASAQEVNLSMNDMMYLLPSFVGGKGPITSQTIALKGEVRGME